MSGYNTDSGSESEKDVRAKILASARRLSESEESQPKQKALPPKIITTQDDSSDGRPLVQNDWAVRPKRKVTGSTSSRDGDADDNISVGNGKPRLAQAQTPRSAGAATATNEAYVLATFVEECFELCSDHNKQKKVILEFRPQIRRPGSTSVYPEGAKKVVGQQIISTKLLIDTFRAEAKDFATPEDAFNTELREVESLYSVQSCTLAPNSMDGAVSGNLVILKGIKISPTAPSKGRRASMPAPASNKQVEDAGVTLPPSQPQQSSSSSSNELNSAPLNAPGSEGVVSRNKYDRMVKKYQDEKARRRKVEHELIALRDRETNAASSDELHHVKHRRVERSSDELQTLQDSLDIAQWELKTAKTRIEELEMKNRTLMRHYQRHNGDLPRWAQGSV
mmetsp:Transcript_1023/g.2480  ORF Transcript_1023/g.2480 Transcript_1023/m.2480 type:complete len:394 (-) Transcript_1023:191-1372(-)|eukprot:CAMPEP_0171501834 /NCGR_PEP_ID=MMETSP0958-20121227/9792_1 /TAXON_ID=87120 /ORGANISM="Aurantiochytrium limacinum, Strain ATCCMYA-1381" /LENGTH=393 /DNA_ID=CAMNT_0012036721 /DNA_START=457 /DNA_END=1638 /DNA_ORIENTATION=-